MKILLVEDDASLGQSIQEWLLMDGHVVDWIDNGEMAKNALLAQRYDCVLLDRGLPGITGDELLVFLRQDKNNVPVLMITAQDTLQDRVMGLDLGADDYLVKPFDLEELSARLRVIARRISSSLGNELSCGHVVLNWEDKIAYVDGESIILTAKEFHILWALMMQPKQVLTRQQLEDKLYSWGSEIESNAVEVHIHHLRKKLGSGYIRTIRNLGYTLNQDR